MEKPYLKLLLVLFHLLIAGSTLSGKSCNDFLDKFDLSTANEINVTEQLIDSLLLNKENLLEIPPGEVSKHLYQKYGLGSTSLVKESYYYFLKIRIEEYWVILVPSIITKNKEEEQITISLFVMNDSCKISSSYIAGSKWYSKNSFKVLRTSKLTKDISTEDNSTVGKFTVSEMHFSYRAGILEPVQTYLSTEEKLIRDGRVYQMPDETTSILFRLVASDSSFNQFLDSLPTILLPFKIDDSLLLKKDVEFKPLTSFEKDNFGFKSLTVFDSQPIKFYRSYGVGAKRLSDSVAVVILLNIFNVGVERVWEYVLGVYENKKLVHTYVMGYIEIRNGEVARRCESVINKDFVIERMGLYSEDNKIRIWPEGRVEKF